MGGSNDLDFKRILREEQEERERVAKAMREGLSRAQARVNGPKEDPINHPSHYTKGGIETIDVIEAWGLGFCLGNTVKYISRAGRKDPGKLLEDLKKARWYLDREISTLEKKSE